MGCLTFIASRLHGDVQLHASTDHDVAVRGVWRPSLKVRCAILCPTSLGDQYLWASDSLLLSFDGQRFTVQKN